VQQKLNRCICVIVAMAYDELCNDLQKLINEYASQRLVFRGGSIVGWPLYTKNDLTVYVYVVNEDGRIGTENVMHTLNMQINAGACRCIIIIDDQTEIHLYDEAYVEINNYFNSDFSDIPRIDIEDYLKRMSDWHIKLIPNSQFSAIKNACPIGQHLDFDAEDYMGGYITFTDESTEREYTYIFTHKDCTETHSYF